MFVFFLLATKDREFENRYCKPIIEIKNRVRSRCRGKVNEQELSGLFSDYKVWVGFLLHPSKALHINVDRPIPGGLGARQGPAASPAVGKAAVQR